MSVKNSMVLSEKSHRFLYETRPDLFPFGRLTDLEIALWEKYYDWKDSLSKNHG